MTDTDQHPDRRNPDRRIVRQSLDDALDDTPSDVLWDAVEALKDGDLRRQSAAHELLLRSLARVLWTEALERECYIRRVVDETLDHIALEHIALDLAADRPPRCAATTRAGRPCRRHARHGALFCTQHGTEED